MENKINIVGASIAVALQHESYTSEHKFDLKIQSSSQGQNTVAVSHLSHSSQVLNHSLEIRVTNIPQTETDENNIICLKLHKNIKEGKHFFTGNN